MIPGKNCPAPTWPSPAPVLTPEHQKPPVTLSCDEEAQPLEGRHDLVLPLAVGGFWLKVEAVRQVWEERYF